MVDKNGQIDIPFIGKVEVVGLSLEFAGNKIKGLLEAVLKEPTVSVRFLNLKYSVLGEVVKPGIYNLLNDKTTLPEALAIAGDLTLYGNRTNIMIIREQKDNRDKLDFFASADVFVFPTFYHGESFGLVLLEAMDASLPCISTDNGEIKNLILENITGFCVRQESIQDIAEKMIWMIENPMERVSMGIQAKRRFDEYYTVEVFEKKLLGIFNDCINI